MTVRAIVIADTHLHRPARVLPAEVVGALRAADLIIHLGDFTDVRVAEELASFAPLRAVHGNNDDSYLRHRFPEQDTVAIEGWSVRLLHGHQGGRTALAAARCVTEGDAVLFGHSHLPYKAMEGERLLFNPGSPTDRRWGPARAYGVIDFGKRIAANIVFLP